MGRLPDSTWEFINQAMPTIIALCATIVVAIAIAVCACCRSEKKKKSFPKSCL